METNSALVRTLIARGELPTPENIARLSAPLIIQEARTIEMSSSVKILRSTNYTPNKVVVEDFTKSYRNRYAYLKNILLNRPSTIDAISIGKLSYSGDSKATIIAMVNDIQKFPSGALKLELEDPTGKITAVVSKDKQESIEDVNLLSLDEVVAIKGAYARKMFFIDEIIWPDVPNASTKCADEEVYAAFSGDMHAGSKTFLPEQMERFIEWINGKSGDEEHRELAKKTKYIFIQGDLVDGIGVYPDQNKELSHTDIFKQYDYAKSYIERIPSDKEIIICPGNHDALRLAEPQPPFYKDMAGGLYDLPNVHCVSNPSTVNIHASANFEGFNVLMYHGYSFDYYLDKIDGLRQAGGYDRPDLLLQFLLKRRHLAPAYESVPLIPMLEDPLLIRETPDIFTTGHIHKAKIMNYKGILGIASSCWQRNTPFQDKVGVKAEPARVPIVNLQNRKAKILEFM